MKLAEAIKDKVDHVQRPRSNRTFFVDDMVFTPDGGQLVSGAVDEMVRIWDVASKKKSGMLDGPKNKVTSVSVSFSPDGKLLASGSMDETVRIWDVGSGEEVAVLEGNLGCINSVAFSPDGKFIAASSTDQVVRTWDVGQKQIVRVLVGHSGPVNRISYCPDGKFIVSAADDLAVKVWNVETGAAHRTLCGHHRQRGHGGGRVARCPPHRLWLRRHDRCAVGRPVWSSDKHALRT